MKKILFGLIACAALCACSDDVVMETSSVPQIALDGNDVYLTVRLNDVGSATRATSSGFRNGNESEYAIANAYFYFYDENGDFVSRAEVADFSDVDGTATGNGTGNIEFQSNAVVVLKGLTDTKFPRYMVTVLNEPAGFETSPFYEPAGTLDEFQELLANATDAIYDGSGNFVMSTSAYATPTYTGQYAADGVSDVSPWYFVTPVNEENFSLEPVGDVYDYNEPVEVYVERLAAKVGLSVSETLAANFEEMTDEAGVTHSVYTLEESVAGEANQDDETVDEGSGTIVEAVDHVYVEFLGWALNGTARNSRMSKDITRFVLDGEAQAVEDVWSASEWNDANNFRSYWGSSYNYGIEHEYPTSNTTGNTDADELSDATWLDEYLKYTSLFEGTESDGTEHIINDFGAYEYCAENTNTTDILLDKRSSGITNALVKARIWFDGEEEGIITTGDIYRFEGMLFTPAAFQQYIAQRVQIDTYLANHMWSRNTTPDGALVGAPALDDGVAHTAEELETAGVQVQTMQRLTYDMLTFVDMGNGLVYVELDMDAVEFDMENDLFWETSVDAGTGETLYTLVSNEEVEAVFANAEEQLETLLDDGYEINAYADGLMYYSIPIEHLNNDYNYPDVQEIQLYEGNYGIVRNHWYELSITGLTNLGKGIWNEEEVIIPDPTEPQSYYVEAVMNVLSWKMVEQSVDL